MRLVKKSLWNDEYNNWERLLLLIAVVITAMLLNIIVRCPLITNADIDRSYKEKFDFHKEE